MSTTCSNLNCPDYKTCTHNIHRDGMRERGTCPEDFYYMSQKQGIWKDYTEKCEAEGIEPLPYNLYFEH